MIIQTTTSLIKRQLCEIIFYGTCFFIYFFFLWILSDQNGHEKCYEQVTHVFIMYVIVILTAKVNNQNESFLSLIEMLRNNVRLQL